MYCLVFCNGNTRCWSVSILVFSQDDMAHSSVYLHDGTRNFLALFPFAPCSLVHRSSLWALGPWDGLAFGWHQTNPSSLHRGHRGAESSLSIPGPFLSWPWNVPSLDTSRACAQRVGISSTSSPLHHHRCIGMWPPVRGWRLDARARQKIQTRSARWPSSPSSWHVNDGFAQA